LSIVAVIAPLIVNLVIVQISLGAYQLGLPWATLILTFAIAVVSGVLISNADKQFAQAQLKRRGSAAKSESD
jgi:Na+/H+-translocating membrane pyrophosphatase